MWFFEYFRFWLRTYVGQTEADFVQDDHRKWNVQHFTQIAQHIDLVALDKLFDLGSLPFPNNVQV